MFPTNKQEISSEKKMNPIQRFLTNIAQNPIGILYTGLALVVFVFSYQHTFSTKSQESSFFQGKIGFNNTSEHRIFDANAKVDLMEESGKNVLTIKATDPESKETVFIKLYNVSRTGTYFIPGDGELPNVGNLIKNLDDFKNKDNFYVADLPNKEGVQNGVGRVNISSFDGQHIEGELILIANNPKGEQALLESAKFKFAIK